MTPKQLIGLLGSLWVFGFTQACAPQLVGPRELQQLESRLAQVERQLIRQEAKLMELANQTLLFNDRMVEEPQMTASVDRIASLNVVELRPRERDHVIAQPEVAIEPVINLVQDDTGELEYLAPLDVVKVANAPTSRSPLTSRNLDNNAGAEALFERGLAASRDGSNALAIASFSELLTRYPQDRYAENALYWLGLSRYEARDYTLAIQDFEKYVENYKKSEKMPEVLLRLGLSLWRGRSMAAAKPVFEQLVKTYPKSAQADLALQKLEESQAGES